MAKLSLKHLIYHLVKKAFHPLWRIGVYVCLTHFYEPVPAFGDLKNIFDKEINMTGIDINEERQLALLNEFVRKYKREYDAFPRHKTSIPYQS